MNIVGKRFSKSEFYEYAKSVIPSSSWKGSFVVLHNTGSPNLSQRPSGLTSQHIQNLKAYYEGQGWSAGPHLFCDQNGIWVFSPLDKKGVHSPSWNSISYGIEQVGDFDIDNYMSGEGEKVRDNAIAAIAIISKLAKIDSTTLKLHKSDPKTDHKNCPGKNCANQYAFLVKGVHDYIVKELS